MSISSTATLATLLGRGREWPDIPLGRAVIDSREVVAGDLFFAIRGERVDGHSFLEQVAKKGAVAAVVDASYDGPDHGLQLFHVHSVRDAMHQIAKKLFQERNPFTIAVTGSVGKTTCKEFIAILLERRFVVAKTPGSYNSQIGLPIAIMNMDSRAQVVVLEMSMSEHGHISKLVDMAPPHLAVLTNIGLSHSCFFQEAEEIARAKSEIFSSPMTKTAVIHSSCFGYRAVQENLPKEPIWCGLRDEDNYQIRGDQIIEFGEERAIETVPLKASHQRENFLLAAAVARKLGVSWEEILEGAAHLRPFKHRFEIIKKGGATIVDDSYNAAPDSCLAALSNLPEPAAGKKRIFVFGSMSELGKFSENAHVNVGKAALKEVDELHCIGEEARPAFQLFKLSGKPAFFYDSYDALKTGVDERIEEGDVVLLKGSNPHALWRYIEK